MNASSPRRWQAFRRSALTRVPVPVAEGMRSARAWAVRTTAQLRRPITLPVLPAPPDAPVRLLVGPANFAGQGAAWARCAEQHLDGVGAQAFQVVSGPFGYPSAYAVDGDTFRHPRFGHAHHRHVLAGFTHVLLEAGRPVLGLRFGSTSAGDARALAAAGLSVALVAHGSDVRRPSRHLEREPESPFGRTEPEYTRVLEARARVNVELFDEHDGPVYVSTPDLLLDVPRATWLPVVVDPGAWASQAPVLQRPRPVVLHAPTNAALKGSEVVDEVLGRLDAAGVVEYRRITGIPAAELAELVRTADVVVDQLRLGAYGVAACEAMAAGRVVVGHVGTQVREHVLTAAGVAVPVLQAVPGTFEATIARVLEDRDEARALAARGPRFVEQVHDGRVSAAALGRWLTPR